MFAKFEIGFLRGHLTRRACSGTSNNPPRWKVTIDDLLRRTETFGLKLAHSGIESIGTQQESLELFNEWRHMLFKIPNDESKILYRSANSIEKLLHMNLDVLLKNNYDDIQKLQSSPFLLDDLTTAIYAWGRTATEDTNSPVRAEALFKKFLRIADSSTNNNSIYRPTSNTYSALVYCWSQARGNDRASEKCRHWFGKIRENRSMEVDSATWNALLRIHIRQKKFSIFERDLLNQYSSLNDGYTFACLVEGWMNLGLSKNACEEFQHGVNYCIDNGQFPALKKLIFVYLSQSIEIGDLVEAERVMYQAISIQENHKEIEILDTKYFIVLMNALAGKGKVNKVMDLFQELKSAYEQGAQRLQPSYQVLVVVLSALTRKQDPRNLEACEDLLSMIETSMSKENQLDCVITNHAFNVMLDFYVRSSHANNGRQLAENLIERMKQLSVKHNNPSLLPDKISYAILMKAIMKDGKSGFFSEIEDLLGTMENSNQVSIRPDKMIYTIVLESLFLSNDDKALFRAEQLLERMKRHSNILPDRVMYSSLMKIHSLFNDVHGSDERLNSMIQSFHDGHNDCSPNEEAFVTAMSSWGQSGRSDTMDGALRIFNNMIGLHKKGVPGCQPSIKTFGKLMVILAKSKHKSKIQTGKQLLCEAEKFGVDPDPSLLNWYIRACTTNTSDVRSDHRESWTEALATFEMLRKNGLSNTHTYNSIFHACHRLLRNQEDQYRFFRDMFSKCKADGQVHRRILTSLKRFLPSTFYKDLTTLDPSENDIDMRKIPASWKRNTN